MRGRVWPSCPPAMRSWSRARRWRRARSTTSTASRCRPSWPRHGGTPVVHRTAADTLEDLSRAVDACLDEDLLVFSGGSSVGERDLDPGRDPRQGRGAVPRHRREAGQADARSGASTASSYSACRATPRRACRTPTSCWCRCCAAWPACRAGGCGPSGCRSARASCRRTAGTSSIPCASWTARPCRPSRRQGDITSMSQADGYIEIDAGTDLVDAGHPGGREILLVPRVTSAVEASLPPHAARQAAALSRTRTARPAPTGKSGSSCPGDRRSPDR